MEKPDWEVELEAILYGIDKDETTDPDGWWETSKGAEFGAAKLEAVKELIKRITSEK